MVVVLWFVTGILCTVATWIIDLRGEEYNDEYFDVTQKLNSVQYVLMGPVTLIVVVWKLITRGKTFTEVLYRMANIGKHDK
ncbi:hypothetical protein [Acetivibrio ethanolgignens]|uniref:Uncharacterized protein n=1 Tax=Acetivibrio ethanolgignens TaxID=290052 RepID=A0A0V8QFX3_9FIRM|nr:hypothetical protein [Acetivibrio ethanolgignens]KSV59142.1 hypothetical protein ASU35_10305 [Acetivibrio ethanolgignens]